MPSNIITGIVNGGQVTIKKSVEECQSPQSPRVTDLTEHHARPVRVAFAGFGTVGKNVAALLEQEFRTRCRVIAIVDSKGAAVCQDGLDLAEAISWKETYGSGSISKWDGYGVPNATTLEVLEEVDVDLLIETTPTNIADAEPGLSNIATALSRAINVITTNKGPIVLSLSHLMELAEKNNSNLRFSGTVGGGTPILEFARHELKNERILSVRGILNATSNYILWKMAKDRISLDEAVQIASNQGIMEKDAHYDLAGIDAACKLVILANSIMQLGVELKDVTIEGIEQVTLNDVLAAESNHKAVKLVGLIENGLRVSPELVDKTDPICVEAENNSICFTTEYNKYILIGKGAGGKETANSVIRDLRHLPKPTTKST